MGKYNLGNPSIIGEERMKMENDDGGMSELNIEVASISKKFNGD